MYDQIYNYFQNNELFYNSQYGFRKIIRQNLQLWK